jgi:hypothetical protein
MELGDMRVKLALSPESREYLSWWVCSLSYLGGKSMLEQSPVLVICSNDSLSGWGGGAVCGEVTAAGPWTGKDIKRHINELELLGALNALR